MKGYRAEVGGFFELFKTRYQALENIFEIKLRLEQQTGNRIDWNITLVELKECDSDFCNNLVEADERHCLACESLRIEPVEDFMNQVEQFDILNEPEEVV